MDLDTVLSHQFHPKCRELSYVPANAPLTIPIIFFDYHQSYLKPEKLGSKYSTELIGQTTMPSSPE
jgi:hypothetical protein